MLRAQGSQESFDRITTTLSKEVRALRERVKQLEQQVAGMTEPQIAEHIAAHGERIADEAFMRLWSFYAKFNRDSGDPHADDRVRIVSNAVYAAIKAKQN